jgi:hypothetical protein
VPLDVHLAQKGGLRCLSQPPLPRARFGVSWIVALYFVIGGIVAATHHYWSNVHTLKAIVSAILATVAWPLLLVGVNLHIH